MYANIQKWGNSNGIRIPKTLMDTARLAENDRVEILADENGIVIKRARRKYASLDELFDGYQGEYRCEEADTGAVGREIL